jgi:hypothetical protein
MITITQRACVLGPKYSGKHQKANQEHAERKTVRLQLERIEVTEAEFNAIFQSPQAWQLLHDSQTKGPSLPLLKHFELKEFNVDGAHVTLWHSLGKEKIEIALAKLSKFAFTIGDQSASGATTLSLTIEGEPPMDAKLVQLLERVGQGIECEFRGDHPEAQADLPLNTHGTGEQKGKGRKFGKRLNG